MTRSYIVSAARTPIGAMLGQFKDTPAPELGAAAISGCLDRVSVNADEIDEVIMGLVLAAGVGQAPARQAALKAGFPSSIAAVTINKVCGSGLKAAMMADQAIRCGDASLIVAGGMENMTRAPFLLPQMRSGNKLGDATALDAMVHDGLTCAFESCHMGLHAEHIATRFNISREEQDRFAAQSQQRAAAAIERGLFREEIAAVTVATRKGELVIDADEGFRPDTTAEGLAKLRPVFDRQGTVTAGNASTISDGGAALLIASEQRSAAIDSPWRARIVSSHTAGTDPKELFIAPVDAVRGAVDKAGLSLDDIDLFEINEAFAAQMLACIGELDLDEAKVNICGGGVSLGHPIGASGARVMVTLLHALHREGKKRGVASLCLGGGNAVAMVVEMESQP